MTSCTERGPWRRGAAVAAVVALAVCMVVAPAHAATGMTARAPGAMSSPGPGEVLVSLTFDDGFADQLNAVPLLAKHDMRATFYIIDGSVRYPAYLTWPQIRSIARAGHEIGGHTSSHPRLTELSADRQRKEICDSRATLLEAGFEVTSFAYPYGDTSPAVAAVVESCGYNTGRDVSGLINGESCDGCPAGNPLPLPEPFRVRANSSTSTVELLKSYVQQAVADAEATGTGSYVPLIFHHICDPCEGASDEEITPQDLDTFLGWLADQPAVEVRTVDDVAGGTVQPPVGTPVQATVQRARVQQPESSTPDSSPDDAGGLRLFGVQLSKQLLLTGGGLVVVTYLVVVLISTRRRGDGT